MSVRTRFSIVAPLLPLVLLSGACDTSESLAEWQSLESMQRVSTDILLDCPTLGWLPVKYDGKEEDEIFFEGEGFWMGDGLYNVAGWEKVQEVVTEFEREAIEECEDDAPTFECPAPCTGATIKGTCEVTSTVAMVDLVPPAAGQPWGAIVRIRSVAKATDLGTCLETLGNADATVEPGKDPTP